MLGGLTCALYAVAGELPEETREDYEQAIALVRLLSPSLPPCGTQGCVHWLSIASRWLPWGAARARLY